MWVYIQDGPNKKFSELGFGHIQVCRSQISHRLKIMCCHSSINYYELPIVWLFIYSPIFSLGFTRAIGTIGAGAGSIYIYIYILYICIHMYVYIYGKEGKLVKNPAPNRTFWRKHTKHHFKKNRRSFSGEKKPLRGYSFSLDWVFSILFC